MSSEKLQGGQPELPAWKQAVIEVMQLRESGRRSIYQRTKLLCERVLNDPDFRASIGGLGNEDAMRELNQYVDDAACEFRELRGMFELFPGEEMWVKEGITRLRAMWVKHLREEEKKKREKEGPIRTRRTVKLAEFKKVSEERDQLEKENSKLQKKLPAVEAKLKETEKRLAEAVMVKVAEGQEKFNKFVVLQDKFVALQNENHRLRAELSKARKEIAELHAKLAVSEQRIAELEDVNIGAGV